MIRARTLPFTCSALVSDVDGTLVKDDKSLTAQAEAAVRDLRANGIAFSIVSSRPPRGLRALLGPLGITTPVIGFNGGMLATPDLQVIKQHLLSPKTAWLAVEMLDAQGVDVWVFSGGDWMTRVPDGPYFAKEKQTVGFGPTVVNTFEPFLDTAAKIVGVSNDFERLVRCEREVQAALAGHASVVRSQAYYLDITHPLANKGTALTEIADLLGVPPAEIAVIGDGGNDVAMFEKSGLSIAMGNASPDVQEAADFVTDSNEEEGFAHAVQRFILGRDRLNAQTEVASAGDRQ